MNWKQKLTSRKLWVAIAGLVSGILIALKTDAATADTIGGLVLALGSVVGYIVGEGLVDASNKEE